MRCRGGTVDFHTGWQEMIGISSCFFMIEKTDVTLGSTWKLLSNLVNLRSLLGSGGIEVHKQSSSPREQANTCTMHQLRTHLCQVHRKVLPSNGSNCYTKSPLTSQSSQNRSYFLIPSHFHSSRRTQQPESIFNASSKVLETPSETSVNTDFRQIWDGLIHWSIVTVQVKTMSAFPWLFSEERNWMCQLTKTVNIKCKSLYMQETKNSLQCSPNIGQVPGLNTLQKLHKIRKGVLIHNLPQGKLQEHKSASTPEDQVSIRAELKLLYLIVFYKTK